MQTQEQNLEKTCMACGMKRRDWPQQEGVMENGHLFCCKGCALGTGCDCKK